MENFKTIERKALKLIATIALLVCAGLSAILLLTGCDNIKALLPSDDDGVSSSPRSIYTISFDANGGVLDDVYKLQTAPDGTLEAFPKPPTYEGKDFYCWTLRKDNLDTRLSLLYTYSSDVTVYACYTDKNDGSGDDKEDGNKEPDNPPATMQVLITFDANGGTVSGVESVTRKTDENGKLEDLPAEPVNENKIFNGWYLTVDANEGDKVLPGRTFLVDTTVYATWRDKIEYTITFDSNGGYIVGSDNNSGIERIKTNEYGKLPYVPDVELDGWIFLGWYENAEEPYGRSYSLSSVFTKDITVYARLKQEIFQITFDENGGVLTDDAVIETGTDGRLPRVPSDPVHADTSLFFKGWGLTPNANIVFHDLAMHVFHSNSTVYAIWTDEDPDPNPDGSGESGEPDETFTLSFDYNYEPYGSNQVDEYTFPKGKVLVRFPELTREGYEHIGWMISPNDNNLVNIGLDGYTVTRDAQFYAKWVEIQSSEQPSETVTNILSGLALDGRVYDGNSQYLSDREQLISDFKHSLGINSTGLGVAALDNYYRRYLVSAAEFNLGESLLDESSNESIGVTKGPNDVKFGFLFDLPETRAAFSSSIGVPGFDNILQLYYMAFDLVPVNENINLDDYDVELELTWGKGTSDVVMEYSTIYKDGQARIYGQLIFTYSAMLNRQLAAFVKVSAKNPSTFDVVFSVLDPELSLCSYDTYVREKIITYYDNEIFYHYILNVPYVFVNAAFSSRYSLFVESSWFGMFTIRKDINASVLGATVVVQVTVGDEISGVPVGSSYMPLSAVKFVSSSGTPLPVSAGFSNEYSCGDITLDYFYPISFDFVVTSCVDTGGYYIAWDCGGGMSVSKIILVSSNYGPQTFDVAGKEYIDLSKQCLGYCEIIFVLA